MDLAQRTEAFASLGDYLKDRLHDPPDVLPSPGTPADDLFRDPGLASLSREAEAANPWFVPLFVHHALYETARLLDRKNLEEWTGRYPASSFRPDRARTVGTVLAGNIPLVGFHDFLCILISGHRFKGKLSGKDDKLLPFLADRLVSLQPALGPFIRFEEDRLGGIDAIIATGSNNTFRYFEYYFGKYAHIFRKNRNGAAILDGTESGEELCALADDVFLYFGMGCRNVAKLYLPENYGYKKLFEAFERYRNLIDHNKYANNYQYQRSVFLMNLVEHHDNGFLLLREDPALSSPVGTLHTQTWDDPGTLAGDLHAIREGIQCIAGPEMPGLSTLPFGRTQRPELWDYADHVDTLEFLFNL